LRPEAIVEVIVNSKIAVVTGGSRGIGRCIALRLSKEAKVIITYIKRGEAAEETIKEIHKKGGEAWAYQFDVSSFKQTQDFFKKIIAKFGRVDYLINNAGIAKDGLILRMKEEAWDEVLAVNLKGTFNCIKAVAGTMIRQGYGRIVNISSVVAFIGNIGQVNYASSKAGIVGLTKAAAREFAAKGITVNAVAPGFIETEMTTKIPDKIKEQILSQIPLGRFGKPEDVAEVVAFLASDRARYITGQVIHVNGGMYM